MLPWTESELDKILVTWQERHPQAVLLTGREGIGLDELALELAHALLCEKPIDGKGRACGKCVACGWFAQGNHPDFRLLQPEIFDTFTENTENTKEKKSEQIKIDQVRDLQSFLSIGSHRGGRRVVVVRPAHAMNVATQNSLLKSLEEPGPGTMFLLVSGEPHRLLPTVRSRCQKLSIPKPGAAEAAAWLQQAGAADASAQLALAGGAPLIAAQMGDEFASIQALVAELGNSRFDPIGVAAAFQSTPPAAFMEILYRWCHDLLSLQSAGRTRYFIQDAGTLSVLASKTSPVALCRYLRRLASARALAQHPLNTKLVYEELLLEYRALIA